jgi:hypothetical protein
MNQHRETIACKERSKTARAELQITQPIYRKGGGTTHRKHTVSRWMEGSYKRKRKLRKLRIFFDVGSGQPGV